MHENRSTYVPFCATQSLGARPEQEDSYGICYDNLCSQSRYPQCFVLADGMGGHVGGAIASQTAVDSVKLCLSERDEINGIALKESLALANESIAHCLEVNPDLEGMGTTLVAVSIQGDRLTWMSVGDSLLLGVDANYNVVRLNEDHSMKPILNSLVLAGSLDANSEEYARKSNQLRSAVHGKEINLYEINELGVPLNEWLYIVIASDGLETLSADDISECCKENKAAGVGTIALALVDAVDKRRSKKQDNITLIILDAKRLCG